MRSYGERSESRENRRNGYRMRDWNTRVGSINLAIPKLRQGSYFPEWLLEPRRRAEKALAQVVAEAHVRGVSTRRVEGLVQTLGLERMSKSRVSELAAELDDMVESFRSRPLDQGPYTSLWLDALFVKCREGGRTVNVAMVIATSVNVDRYHEILGSRRSCVPSLHSPMPMKFDRSIDRDSVIRLVGASEIRAATSARPRGPLSQTMVTSPNPGSEVH